MERYEKIRQIGQGAFGKVFLCRRRADRSLLVIKEIPVEEMKLEERTSAANEVDILQRLHHPNIIAYYNHFSANNVLMIVMEYAPGGTLYDFIQERNGTLLEEEHILQLFAQLLVAMEHIHSINILHRDLKTQNVMFNKKRSVLKIGDFGISKVLSSQITSGNTVVGTPCYISPEICEGRKYHQKSDVWALGCILYELTTLKKAFDGDNMAALVMKIMKAAAVVAPIDPRYDKGLWALIVSLLQLKPAERPGIASVMAAPILVNTLINLCTDIGRLPCTRSQAPPPQAVGGVAGEDTCVRNPSLGRCRQRSFFQNESKSGTLVVSKPQVLLWGGGLSLPTTLPALPDASVVGVALGRMQQAGTTEEGKLVFWEPSSGSLSMTCVPTATQGRARKEPLIFIPRFMSGLTTPIKKVACGDMFTACLTVSGIVMTFGNGMSGCLGHGDYKDISEPKLVEAMLSFNTVELVCGANHVLAITADQTVYTWGKGDNGQLGLGSRDPRPAPCPAPLPPGAAPRLAACGPDCSIIVTEDGRVMAVGSNRYNKLALHGSSVGVIDTKPPSTEGVKNLQGAEDTTPAILSLHKDSPNIMQSSFILSSLHMRKISLGKKEGARERDGGRGGGGGGGFVVGGREGEGGKGSVTVSLSFQYSNSELLRKIVAVSTGTKHTALVTESGACVTCGDNSCGQLGHRGRREGVRGEGVREPSVVELGGREVERVACGDFFTVATTKGEVVCGL